MLMPIIEGETITLTLHLSYIANEDILRDTLLLNPMVLCDDVSDVMAARCDVLTLLLVLQPNIWPKILDRVTCSIFAKYE